MDRKLQRHRADSLRQHGFLVIFYKVGNLVKKFRKTVYRYLPRLRLNVWCFRIQCVWIRYTIVDVLGPFFKVKVMVVKRSSEYAYAYDILVYKAVSSKTVRVANVPSRLRLRSSNSDQVMVPSYNLTTVGRRAFPVFAANLWNSLPANLTSAPSLMIFRQRLKTHLFRRSYPDLIIWHSDL